MGLRIPAVEVSDHGNVAGVRSPDAEDDALHSLRFHDVGAHLLVNAIVAALVEQVKIVGSQQGNVVADGGELLSWWCRGHDCTRGLVYSNSGGAEWCGGVALPAG